MNCDAREDYLEKKDLDREKNQILFVICQVDDNQQ